MSSNIDKRESLRSHDFWCEDTEDIDSDQKIHFIDFHLWQRKVKKLRLFYLFDQWFQERIVKILLRRNLDLRIDIIMSILDTRYLSSDDDRLTFVTFTHQIDCHSAERIDDIDLCDLQFSIKDIFWSSFVPQRIESIWIDTDTYDSSF